MFIRITLSLLLVLFNSASFAGPDFFILPNQCKLLLAKNNGELSLLPGDPPSYACTRKEKTMFCTVGYTSGRTTAYGTNAEEFAILVDSPPILLFGSGNGATLFYINLENRQVGISARLISDSYIGNKVCTALYTTKIESDLMRNQRKKR